MTRGTLAVAALCRHPTTVAARQFPAHRPHNRGYTMDYATRRRIVFGIISFLLGVLVTRLAHALTDRLLGPPPDGESA